MDKTKRIKFCKLIAKQNPDGSTMMDYDTGKPIMIKVTSEATIRMELDPSKVRSKDLFFSFHGVVHKPGTIKHLTYIHRQ